MVARNNDEFLNDTSEGEGGEGRPEPTPARPEDGREDSDEEAGIRADVELAKFAEKADEAIALIGETADKITSVDRKAGEAYQEAQRARSKADEAAGLCSSAVASLRGANEATAKGWAAAKAALGDQRREIAGLRDRADRAEKVIVGLVVALALVGIAVGVLFDRMAVVEESQGISYGWGGWSRKGGGKL